MAYISLDVTPGKTGERRSHRGCVHAKHLGQLYSITTLSVQKPGVSNAGLSKFGVREHGAFGLPPLFVSVEHVFEMSADSQVVGVDIGGDVVSMQDMQAFRNLAAKNTVRDSVSQMMATTMGELAISVSMKGSCPQPGGVWWRRVSWHKQPKDIEQFESLSSATTNRTSVFGISVSKKAFVVRFAPSTGASRSLAKRARFRRLGGHHGF